MNLKRASCMITSHNQVQRYLYTKSDPRVLNDETPKSHCYNKIINNFPRILHAVTFSWERRSEYKLLIGEKRKSSEYIACNGKIAASDVLNLFVKGYKRCHPTDVKQLTIRNPKGRKNKLYNDFRLTD